MRTMTAEQVWRSLSPGERQRYLAEAHERTPHRPEDARDIARESALADARRDARVIGAVVDEIRSTDVRGVVGPALAGSSRGIPGAGENRARTLSALREIRAYFTLMNVRMGREDNYEDSKLRYRADAALDRLEAIVDAACDSTATVALRGVATGERGGEG